MSAAEPLAASVETPDSIDPTWDGRALLAAFVAGTDCLDASKDRVNALNVFPVPDGDTGTNMSLTMRTAIDEVRAASADLLGRAGEVAARLAYGALMGARGNSGVILSQMLRGFAEGIGEREVIDGVDLARALTRATELAYRAVAKPVEGTMLTVIRAAAERAEAAAGPSPLPASVLTAAHRGAAAALTETPQQLEILRQAGVVDAGGQGIVLILDGMACFARGQEVPAPLPALAGGLGAEMAFLDKVGELHGENAFGYCTNFMIFGEGIDFERARTEIAAMGESAVIVGNDRVVKVHIHALNPGKVLDYALGLGELGQIKIDNMNAQTRALSEQRSVAPAPPAPPQVPQPIGKQAVVAVAAGDGLEAALRSMGAAVVVRGGQAVNPSTQELLSAVEGAPGDEVILLPNNPNVLLAAAQVASLTEKRVRVVPSRSVPQGLAALEAFSAEAGLDENAARMEAALPLVTTIELTRAVRDATIGDVSAMAGQVIALRDDELAAAADDEAEALRAALATLNCDEAELVTIFFGQEVTEADAAPLESVVTAACPTAEIEIRPGGQPHYRFVIGVQ